VADTLCDVEVNYYSFELHDSHVEVGKFVFRVDFKDLLNIVIGYLMVHFLGLPSVEEDVYQLVKALEISVSASLLLVKDVFLNHRSEVFLLEYLHLSF
jgi:hypothetical protein